jgi:enamine deaminase RidA (YjgF/YER057c/UK114 family)
MANTRLISAIAAAGFLAAGVPAGIAWAGGPGGTVEDTNISAAVGTGTFVGELDGFTGFGATNEEASASVLAQCNAAGGVDCTVDEVTNDNLCIVSVADDMSDVVAGGAGPTVPAAVADAFARAAANNTPLGPNSPVVVSSCP